MGAIAGRASSIRVSLFLCIIAALLAAQGLYLIAQRAIDGAMLDLMDPRPDSIVFDSDRVVAIHHSETGVQPGSTITDQARFDRYRALRSAAPIAINGVCVLAAVALYYRFKLQRPLTRLQDGIQNIADNNLDFHLVSGSDDELGRLCGAFEEMRARLADSYRALWRSQEDQRGLYRAFAHDLRTPLTIIKGNNEIIELVAAKNGDWDRALEAASLSDSAIRRIELYAEQLRELEGMEGMRPHKTACDLEKLGETIRRQTAVLAGRCDKRAQTAVDARGTVEMDRDLVLRVVDNLLANALKHAEQGIAVRMELRDESLSITVEDDGPGFTPEALKKAVIPFWSTDKVGGHAGLGLTVAKALAELCGGDLRIGNGESGARVTFSIPV